MNASPREGNSGMQELQAQLQRFKRDTAYYEQHREELLEKYPEQWVAIFREKVVGASPDLDQLFDDLESKGVPLGQGLIEYLTRRNEVWILFSW